MPTERFGKVRRMLKNSLAHVVRRIPFTIQLDYDTTDFTQPITLGIDAGIMSYQQGGTLNVWHLC